MEQNLNLNENSKTGILLSFLFCFYLFYCFFEPYINNVVGAGGKYLIFLVIICFVLSYHKIRFEWYHLSVILWLLLKSASIFWASFNYIVQLHFFSQIGMVALFITMSLVSFNDKFIKSVINTALYSSFLIGILSLFYSRPFLSETFNDRQVLTLFGVQNDPNDQAAFLLVGIAIALNVVLNGKALSKIFNVMMVAICLVNAYAILLTGSRGGLMSLMILILAAILLSGRSEKSIPKKLAKNFVFLGLFGLSLYIIANNYLPADSFKRMFDFTSYLGGSGRMDIWENVLPIFLNSPVFGGGWGSYWGYNGYYTAVHNTFLSVLTDSGIVGFLLLFMPVFVIGSKAMKKGYALPFLIFIAGFAPSLFLDAINKRFFWNALIVSLILITNQINKDRKVDNEEKIKN